MRWILWPGEKACDLVGLTAADDRQGFRTFVNMIVWGFAIVAAALLLA